MSSYSREIDHSDRAYSDGLKNDFKTDFYRTRFRLRESFPDREDVHDEYAKKMAYLLQDERQRRIGHYYLYKMQARVGQSQPLFNTDLYLPERSLLDIEQRTNRLSADEMAQAKILGKGISIELGHIDQYGDWSGAHPLDEEMRSLPESPALERAGFVFADTYADKSNAKISYRFHAVVDSEGSEVAIKATRRRAAADIITRSGVIYDIVKSSSFLINRDELSEEHQDAIEEVSSNANSMNYTTIAQEVGGAIVEPYVGDKDLQQRGLAVLAATSLYFALRRD